MVENPIRYRGKNYDTLGDAIQAACSGITRDGKRWSVKDNGWVTQDPVVFIIHPPPPEFEVVEYVVCNETYGDLREAFQALLLMGAADYLLEARDGDGEELYFDFENPQKGWHN